MSRVERSGLSLHETEHDADLVALTIEGDGQAFEQLIRRYLQSVRGIVWSIVGETETTQDICQEVFLVAYRSLSTLVDRDRFSSWLCSIARYQAYGFVRTKGRLGIKARFACEPHLIEDVQRLADPAEILDQNERVRGLHLAIRKMRPEYREVVELRFWREMSVKDIAGFLGLPDTTVKWRLYKAREALRALVKELR